MVGLWYYSLEPHLPELTVVVVGAVEVGRLRPIYPVGAGLWLVGPRRPGSPVGSCTLAAMATCTCGAAARAPGLAGRWWLSGP